MNIRVNVVFTCLSDLLRVTRLPREKVQENIVKKRV